MSPKGKAEELIEKFSKSTLIFYDRVGLSEVKYEARRCALIAVDEILNNFGSLVGDKTHYCNYLTTQYYQEVKEEIEKL